ADRRIRFGCRSSGVAAIGLVIRKMTSGGRSPAADPFGDRFPPACRRRPGRSAEPQPHRNRCVCAADEQPEMGGRTAHCAATESCDRFAEGLRRERVTLVALDKTTLAERTGKLPA